jgi:hypothetical protein
MFGALFFRPILLAVSSHSDVFRYWSSIRTSRSVHAVHFMNFTTTGRPTQTNHFASAASAFSTATGLSVSQSVRTWSHS